MPEVPASVDRHVLPRVLGPVAAFCVVVGCVIGSGIFMVPASVAHDVPFVGGILLVWIVAGILSGLGALTLAELGAMMPQAGGPYVYLRAAYGRLPAFLFGWTEFTIERTGSMATLAAAFSRYFIQLVGPPDGIDGKVWQGLVAITAIAIVTAVNILGTRRGGALQVFGTFLKVGGVLALIALPLILRRGGAENLSPIWPQAWNTSVVMAMLAAMVHVLWAYDGWINVTPLAEEVREPGRNIPRALILGMGSLIAVYLSMTLAYHFVLPLGDIAAANDPRGRIEKAVAAVYCQELLGQPGVVAISMLVMCSTFISLNGNALTGPRAYFAMARDGLLPPALGRIHPRFQTPANAVLAQGLWASMLVVVGTAIVAGKAPAAAVDSTGPAAWLSAAWIKLHETPLYDILLTYVIFGANLFYLLAISSVFVLRAKYPDLERPYRTWGYPITPILYVIVSVIFLGSMLINEQSRVQAIVGAGLILLGIPAFAILKRGDEPEISRGSTV
ncbi:APC family permease [Aquisphaera insulae]|uniref:APC family permease n=1 Tax=Aquisphaera insulae TaxID=2712864 RepID=UPI0013E9F29E|nr:amino acid permease [Aquisphaera insulae]